jgi:hypothetical protein
MDLGSLSSLVPGAEVGDSGFGTSAEACCECAAEDCAGDDGSYVRMSPCATPIMERARQREGQEQENMERLEREEIVCRENELKAQIGKAALMEAKEAGFGGKPQKLNDGSENNSGAVFHRVRKNPGRHTSQKMNDGSENNYGAVFHRVNKNPSRHTSQKMNDGSENNYGAVFHRVQKNPVGKTSQKLNDRNDNNYSAVFHTVKKEPVKHLPQKTDTRVKRLELGGEGLYNSCDCRRKNGLQNDCRLTFCHGRPQCLTDPPTCVHSGGIWYK